MKGRSLLATLSLGVALVVAGCSSSPTSGTAAGELAAKKKLAAINKLSETMAKDPNSDETFIALEDFRNNYFDPKTGTEITKQILEVYDTKIKGRYKGQYAQEVDSAVSVFRSDLNRK